MDLEEVWRIREEEVYPGLFGPTVRGLFPLSAEQFEQVGMSGIDPRWLTIGVLEYAPTPARKSWLYVTSGHSNPWEAEAYDPDDESGSGIEFTLETTARGDWAIARLQEALALDIALGAGLEPDRDALSLEDILDLEGPINGDPASRIRHLVVTQSLRGPLDFALPSGRVHLLNLVGITDSEAAFADARGADILLQRLAQAGWGDVTDPERAGVT